MSHCGLIAAIITTAIFSLLDVASSGGSCQSYGHSCLGGHGKRSGEMPVALRLLQDAIQRKEKMPFYDLRLPESESYEFFRNFNDDLKSLDDGNSK